MCWKPGGNFSLDLAPSQSGAKLLVADTWDGSAREVKVEVVPREQAQPTSSSPVAAGSVLEGSHPEPASTSTSADGALTRIAGQSIAELRSALRVHGDIQQRAADPSAVEVLQADRLLAAANTKAVRLIIRQ